MELFTSTPYAIANLIPTTFWKKDANEMFAAVVLSVLLNLPHEFRRGIPSDNPKRNEPDLLFGDVAFEVTFASERTKDGLINRVRTGKYSSENMQQDTLEAIEAAVIDKASKSYCIPDVNLCVICVCPLLTWIAEDYGSVYVRFSKQATDKIAMFDRLKKNYIRRKNAKKNRFKTIWLLFPDIFCGWTLQNVATNEKTRIQIDLRSTDLPKYASTDFINMIEKEYFE